MDGRDADGRAGRGRKGKRRRRPAGPDPAAAAPLEAVLAALGAADWDVAVVGDGSGSEWFRPCGWAAVVVERASGRRRVLTGAMSSGGGNLAELLPYLQALLWLEACRGRALRAGLGRPPRVHVVTDSRLAADQGSGRARRRTNAAVWAAIDELAAGYDLRWHWLGRDRAGLNVLTDGLSKACRRALAAARPAGAAVQLFDRPAGAGAEGKSNSKGGCGHGNGKGGDKGGNKGGNKAGRRPRGGR